MQKIQNYHRPPHYLSNDHIYFITASTYHNKALFSNDKMKKILKNIIVEKANRYNVKIIAYVIMDSHYHILLKIEKGRNIPDFVKGVNGKSAYLLNNIEKLPERMVWYNYWDVCIREAEDFWKRFNYIHHNPVKHGYSERMEDYEYSSYKKWLESKGDEWMKDVLERYPVIDFTKGDE